MYLKKFMFVLLLSLTSHVSGRVHNRRCREPINNKDDFEDRLHDSFFQIPPLSQTVANISSIPPEYVNVRRSLLTGNARCPTWEESLRHHDGNLCPFHYVLNFDENRLPNTMVETKCNCIECLSSNRRRSRLLDCQPILYYTKVFRRQNCVDGVFVYEPIWEPLQVGCQCMHAPTRMLPQRARSPE